jgi:ribosome biogenesis GTPase / thiamine phosphate phosphatase
VRAALETGELSARRWESWRKLQRELAYEARRKDARLAAEERARWKKIQQQGRRRSRP